MASASLTGRGAAAGATAGGAGVRVPWSYWRENLVSPPRLRIWACSIQFSRPMRPSTAEQLLEALDVGRRPVGDLRVAGDALRNERRSRSRVDAADALQVVAGRRCGRPDRHRRLRRQRGSGHCPRQHGGRGGRSRRPGREGRALGDIRRQRRAPRERAQVEARKPRPPQLRRRRPRPLHHRSRDAARSAGAPELGGARPHPVSASRLPPRRGRGASRSRSRHPWPAPAPARSSSPG